MSCLYASHKKIALTCWKTLRTFPGLFLGVKVPKQIVSAPKLGSAFILTRLNNCSFWKHSGFPRTFFFFLLKIPYMIKCVKRKVELALTNSMRNGGSIIFSRQQESFVRHLFRGVNILDLGQPVRFFYLFYLWIAIFCVIAIHEFSPRLGVL